MSAKAKAIYKLTRLDTIMDFYPILMVLGIVGARIAFDWEVLLALVINLLLFVFAFMINDIADAEDDARDPKKALRNPVSAGVISRSEAYIATFAVAAAAVLPSILLGERVLALSAVILIIGYLYSAKPLRLKSRPIVDILSHGFFLAFAQIVFFGLLPGASFDSLTLLLGVGVYLFSIGGDLYNEVRDWEVDQQAGLKNTANLIGYAAARRLVYLFWALGMIMVITVSFVIGVPVVIGSIGSL